MKYDAEKKTFTFPERYQVELQEMTFYIRRDMMGAMDRYLNQKLEPGLFLTAILSNDFVRAARHADSENLANLPAYASFLYNEMPMTAWGSREIVTAWLNNNAKKETT